MNLARLTPHSRWIQISLAACLAVACAGTIRGPAFGPDDPPYLRDDLQAAPVALPALAEPAFRLILAGDGGDPLPEDDPTLALLARWSDAFPERTAVVFLGDNVYPAGLQDEERDRAERILRQQLEAGAATKIFVPGNHDWGWTLFQQLSPGVLRNQQEFIEAHDGVEAHFAPRNGCPGPEKIALVEPEEGLPGGLFVLALDLHWWLLPEETRPPCEGLSDTPDVLERLTQTLGAHRDHNVVVVSHHPLRSGGPHGGASRGFFANLGASVARRFYSLQDLIEPEYADMVEVLSEVLAEAPPAVMAGGHDHSLQVLEGGDTARVAIVSGAAARITPVVAVEGTLFAHAHPGFVVLDFHRDGESRDEVLVVHVVETGRGGAPVFSLPVALGEAPVAAPVPVRVPAP